MKKVLSTIGLMVVLGLAMMLGCNSECDLAAGNKEIVLASIEATNNQQWDDLGKYFAPDFHRYSQATPDVVIESLDDMRGFIKEWYTSFPDAKMVLRKVAAEGDLVAIWVTFEGTHLAPMGPFPATGKRMESETFGFFRLEEGLIKEAWVTWDNIAGLTQLGLFPPPPPTEADADTGEQTEE